MASRADRAKIFLPFNPLKGFTEALEAQERVRIPKPELAEDAAVELDRTLRRLQPGEAVSVIYYADGACHHHSGVAREVDARRRHLVLEDTAIAFDGLIEVRREAADGENNA